MPFRHSEQVSDFSEDSSAWELGLVSSVMRSPRGPPIVPYGGILSWFFLI